MQIKKFISETAAALLSAALIGLFGTSVYYSERLPETITVSGFAETEIAQYPEITLCSGSAGQASEQADLSLFGIIPVKKVEVRQAKPPELIVGGQPFGIKLLMDGVMVTALGKVEADSENTVCPAAEAGVKVGDIIRTAADIPLTSNAQLQDTISSSGGEPLELSVERDGIIFNTTLKPVYSEISRQWKGGMWVRDSIAGIGTMTFIDKATGRFAGLGHPICDSDTGGIVPVHSGEAVPVEITDTKRGERGIPGELRGRFTSGSFGSLDLNNGCGVFGKLNEEALKSALSEGEVFPLGYRQEITTGNAEIFTTVNGHTPQRYAIEIESIDYSGKDNSKNMKIRITDEKLLESSGGIVQGMSGSPIIQNGRLIGAVTHVFVAEPDCGFAVFADNMAEFLG